MSKDFGANFNYSMVVTDEGATIGANIKTTDGLDIHTETKGEKPEDAMRKCFSEISSKIEEFNASKTIEDKKPEVNENDEINRLKEENAALKEQLRVYTTKLEDVIKHNVLCKKEDEKKYFPQSLRDLLSR